MFSWLKKHFIPHEGNNHRPHILRNYSVRILLLIIIFIEVVSFLVPTISRINVTDGMAAVLPGVLSALTNNERQSQNLSTLAISPVLNKAAEMKATDMATKGYFAHISPEGKTPWYWLEQVGYKYQYAGENLAINFSDSQDVTNAWINSPTHKANIVKGNYTEIGTGVANGIYNGRETVFVAQVYANPLPRIIEQNQSVKIVKTTIKNVTEVPKITAPKEPANILGAETATNTENNINQSPTFWQKLLASPRNTTNIILFIIFGIIFIALLLYIFIKIRNHHLDLLTNGLIIIALIGAILALNYYWSHNNMVVSDSLNYSSESK